MPFNIGSPFSPEYLRLVQAQQQRGDENARFVTQLGMNRDDDKFRRTQLSATMADNEAERNLRREIAHLTTQSKNEIDDSRREHQLALLNEKTRQFNDMLAEKARNFDLLLPIKEQMAEAGVTRAEASKSNAVTNAGKLDLSRQVEFGTGTPDDPSPGSKAATRSALTDRRVADTDFAKMRTEEVVRRLDGRLPEQIDRAKRTEILSKAQELHERAFRLKTANDAAKLATDLLKALRNPITGGFSDPGTTAAIGDLSSSIFGNIAAYSDQFAAAFADAIQSETQKELAKEDEGIRAKRRGERTPPTTGDDAARKAMEALNAAREEARRRAIGTPPSPVGK